MQFFNSELRMYASYTPNDILNVALVIRVLHAYWRILRVLRHNDDRANRLWYFLYD